MGPVHRGHPPRVDHMSQIIFGIGQDEGRVPHCVVLVGRHRLLGRRELRRTLGCGNSRFAAGQADQNDRATRGGRLRCPWQDRR